MLVNTLVGEEVGNIAVGDVVSSDFRTLGKGYVTVEVSGGTGVTASVFGKAVLSSDANVDSGWVELVSATALSADTLTGYTIDLFPHISVVLTGNGSKVTALLTHSNQR